MSHLMSLTHSVTLNHQLIWHSFSLSTFICKTVFLMTPILRDIEVHEKKDSWPIKFRKSFFCFVLFF